MKKILFIDIETCSLYKEFSLLPSREKSLWIQKCSWFIRNNSNLDNNEESFANLYRSKAAIYAEFGKIICISVALQSRSNGQEIIEFRNFCHSNENLLLRSFACFLEDQTQFKNICGHNIREFDIPFLARRFSIHGIKIPEMLNLKGKRPWQIKHLLDTMELWKFGDYKNYTSLQLLAYIFGLEDPKDEISGADIHKLYWEEANLKRIEAYCQQDVSTVLKLYNRMCPQDKETYAHQSLSLYT